jgi:hypothetical protein
MLKNLDEPLAAVGKTGTGYNTHTNNSMPLWVRARARKTAPALGA